MNTILSRKSIIAAAAALFLAVCCLGAARAAFTTAVPDVTIVMDIHAPNTGWVNGAQDASYAQAMFHDNRLNAVRMRLDGVQASAYTLMYRAKILGKGWTDWVEENTVLGDPGVQEFIESVETRMTPVK